MTAQATEILLLAAVAAFLLFRLKGVLGTRDGHENPSEYLGPGRKRSGRRSQRDDVEEAKVIPMRPEKAGKGRAGEESWPDLLEDSNGVLAERLGRLIGLEPDFSPRAFSDNARVAYEIITEAFASGNRATLRELLSDDVYDGFEAAIRSREEDGLKVERAIETLEEEKITAIEIIKAPKEDAPVKAEITVRFRAQVRRAVRGRDGTLVEGSADGLQREEGLWTFARELGDSDPTWVLVSTQ